MEVRPPSFTNLANGIRTEFLPLQLCLRSAPWGLARSDLPVPQVSSNASITILCLPIVVTWIAPNVLSPIVFFASLGALFANHLHRLDREISSPLIFFGRFPPQGGLLPMGVFPISSQRPRVLLWSCVLASPLFLPTFVSLFLVPLRALPSLFRWFCFRRFQGFRGPHRFLIFTLPKDGVAIFFFL